MYLVEKKFGPVGWQTALSMIRSLNSQELEEFIWQLLSSIYTVSTELLWTI